MNEFGKYLSHYGIKGQKKGIRRYQYEDGTLTPEGKERYGIKDNDKYYEYSKVKKEYNILGKKKSEKRMKKGGVGTLYYNKFDEMYFNTPGDTITVKSYEGTKEKHFVLNPAMSIIAPVLKSNSKDVVLENRALVFDDLYETMDFISKPAKFLVKETNEVNGIGEKEYKVISKKDLKRKQNKKELEKQNKKKLKRQIKQDKLLDTLDMDYYEY